MPESDLTSALTVEKALHREIIYIVTSEIVIRLRISCGKGVVCRKSLTQGNNLLSPYQKQSSSLELVEEKDQVIYIYIYIDSNLLSCNVENALLREIIYINHHIRK